MAGPRRIPTWMLLLLSALLIFLVGLATAGAFARWETDPGVTSVGWTAPHR